MAIDVTGAQAFARPNHLGSMVETVARAVARYGPENLGPGDAIVVNEPYTEDVHLNDIVVIAPVYHRVIAPVYHREEIFGYVASLAHHVDVGGGYPASVGAFREVFQEGVIIPPVKLVEGGGINSDVFNLILA